MSILSTFDQEAYINGVRGVPRRFVLRLVQGDLTQSIADCFAVNHYSGWQVTGAAGSVDLSMGGVLNTLAARGVFDAPPGSVYFVPAFEAPMSADTVAVLSMGEYERFIRPDTNIAGAEHFIHDQLRQFGYSLAVACCEVRLRKVASIVHGTSQVTGIAPATAVHFFLAGYYHGLEECAQPGHTYFLTLVDLNLSKIEAFRSGIQNAIVGGDVGSLRPVEMAAGEGTSNHAVQGVAPDVWMADLDTDFGSMQPTIPPHLRLGALLQGGDRIKFSIIGTGSADQVVFDQFPDQSLDDMRLALQESIDEIMAELTKYEQLTQAAAAQANMPDASATAREKIAEINQEAEEQMLRYGRTLFNQLFNPTLAEDIRTRLHDGESNTLLLRLDEGTSSIPWELLADDRGLFGLTRSIGRQLELVGQVRQPPPRRTKSPNLLRILIVANPTGDLVEVEREARRVLETLYALPGVEVHITALFGDEAKRRHVVPFLNDHVDIFHYAGHAFYNAEHPSESGLVLTDYDVVTADMMWSLPDPPGLVFFNACDSAVAAEAAGNVKPIAGGHYTSELPLGSIGALLRAGTHNFIGTQWPVEDAVAAEMAIACYAALANGHTVGEALRQARLTTIETMGFGHLSWASYVLYGLPWRRLLDG